MIMVCLLSAVECAVHWIAADRDKALGRFAWAMLSSMEFFTNH